MRAANRNNYDWLVKRRCNIQEFLLVLHKRLLRSKRKSKPRQILHLLLGVGFSLWRAAFLIHKHKKSQDDCAIEFLKTLIEENAIAFRQDKDASAWTVGYYLNDAYFRLQMAYQMLKSKNMKLGKTVDSFFEKQKKIDKIPDPKKSWDNAYKSAKEIFRNNR